MNGTKPGSPFSGTWIAYCSSTYTPVRSHPSEVGRDFVRCNRQNAMFRITVEEGPTEEKWILQGQLTGDFASELNANWQSSQARDSNRVRVVDLSDVTVIDKNGEEVLLAMIRQGAKCAATGLYTRHLLEELKSR